MIDLPFYNTMNARHWEGSTPHAVHVESSLIYVIPVSFWIHSTQNESQLDLKCKVFDISWANFSLEFGISPSATSEQYKNQYFVNCPSCFSDVPFW